jgi:hypothetical protein
MVCTLKKVLKIKKKSRHIQVDDTTISCSEGPKFKLRPKYFDILRVYAIFLSPASTMFEISLKFFSQQLS